MIQESQWREVMASGRTNRGLVQRYFNESAGFRHMGLEVDLSGERGPQMEIARLQDFHRGGTTIQSVNGAVIAYVCDAAMGMAAIFHTDLTKGSGVGRLAIRMSKPVEGTSLKCRSWVERAARNLVYAVCEIMNESDEICVRATGTVYVNR